MNTKKLVIIISAISLLVIGVVVVSAQRGWDGPRGFMQMRGAAGEMQAVIQEYTGLDLDGLQAALSEGSTLAELIEANDKSVDDFTAAMLAEMQERLDLAVENGRIDADQAAQYLAQAAEQIAAHLSGDLSPMMGRFGGMGGGFYGWHGGPYGNSDDMHALIEEYTGLDAPGLRTALADGSTLAELIEANGQSVDDFTAAALEQAEARITERLNSTLPMGGMMGRGFHGEGWRGQGPMAPETTAEADA